jgi:hypothetical protein
MSFKRKKNVEKKDNCTEDNLNNNHLDNKNEIEELNRFRLKNLIVFIQNLNEQINSNKKLISRYQQIKKNDVTIQNSFKKNRNANNQDTNIYKRKGKYNNVNSETNISEKKEELDELEKDFKKDLDTKKTKFKIDNDQIIEKLKREKNIEKENLLKNNQYIINGLEDEYNDYKEKIEETNQNYITKEKCEENLKIFEDNLQKYINFQNFIINDYYGKALEKESKKGNISSNLTDISSISNIKSLPSLSNNSKGSLMNAKNGTLKKGKK